MAGLDVEDTIAAIASPPGPGVRGIVRISGPQVAACLEPWFQPHDARPLGDYRSTSAISGQFCLPSKLCVPGELLFWPTSQSYTRQPTAEFHTVGSTPVLQMVLDALCGRGARLARPGEFTLRAFLSGRIDLTQAEAVLAVIDADGDQQLETALQQLAGGLAGPLGQTRDTLMSILAELEAGLDFVEEDIEFISTEELTRQLTQAQRQLEKVADQITSRNVVSEAYKVVLVGLPNSGKSSLFNSLCGSEQAIVTDVAGTTTDFVTADVDWGSVPFQLIDTAGFETPDQEPDSDGLQILPDQAGTMHSEAEQKPNGSVRDQSQVQRTNQQGQADVRLICLDCSRRLSHWDVMQLDGAAPATIAVITKSDVGDPLGLAQQIVATGFSGPIVTTSSLRGISGVDCEPAIRHGQEIDGVQDCSATGFGMQSLQEQVVITALQSQPSDQGVVGTTVLRAAESLRDSQKSVVFALDATQQQRGEEIVAAEIRQALEHLGQVVGTVYTDDILDLVFGRFCIGK